MQTKFKFLVQLVFHMNAAAKQKSMTQQGPRRHVFARRCPSLVLYFERTLKGTSSVPEKLAITCASRELLRTPHPFHVFLNNSHPPLDDRLKAIRDYYGKYYNERMWACWSNQGKTIEKDRNSRSIRAFAEHAMVQGGPGFTIPLKVVLPFHSKLHYTLCKRLVEARCL